MGLVLPYYCSSIDFSCLVKKKKHVQFKLTFKNKQSIISIPALLPFHFPSFLQKFAVDK